MNAERKIGDVLTLVANESHEDWHAAEDTFLAQLERHKETEGVNFGGLEDIEYGDYLRSDGRTMKVWKAKARVVSLADAEAA